MRYKAIIGDELILGKQGENGAVTIVFPVSALYKEFGSSGRFMMLHQRAEDKGPYQCDYMQTSEGLEWTVSNADNAHDGIGELELRYIVKSVVVKSMTWKTRTLPALERDSDPPEPFKSWVDDVIREGDKIVKAAENIAAWESSINSQVSKAEDKIAAKGEATLASIPADYTELSESKTDIENEIGYMPIAMVKGYYIRTGIEAGNVVDINNPIANASYAYGMTPVNGGDVIIVNGEGGGGPRLWGFLDGNYRRLEVADSGAVATNLEVVVPNRAAYVVINDSTNKKSFLRKKNSHTQSISELKDDVSYIKNSQYFGNAVEWHDDSWIATQNSPVSGEIVPNTYGVSCCVVDVSEGQTWSISGKGSTLYRLFCVVDKDGNQIEPFIDNWASRYTASTDRNRTTGTNVITMPKGATKMYVNVTVKAERDVHLVTPRSRPSSTLYIAAYNSSEHDKEIADFVCGGDHDEYMITEALAHLEDGGTLKLLLGDYIIDSFPFTTGIFPCAIELKDNGRARNVTIEGVRGTYPLTDKSTRIIVSDNCYNGLSDNNQVAIISQDRPSRQHRYWFNNAMNVKDILIELPNCTKPVICICQMATVYGECTGVICYNRTTRQYVLDLADGQTRTDYAPTPNLKSVAFYGISANNSWYYCRYHECFAQGFGCGFDIGGDHFTLVNCATSRNIYGYAFGRVSACSHHITLINCCSETDCRYMYFGDKTQGDKEPIVISNFQIEINPAVAPNYPNKKCEEANPNTQWVGEITYSCAPEQTEFFEPNNGLLFDVTNLRAKRSGTSAQRPTHPNYLEKYYDTSISKVIYWNGDNWIDAVGTVV